MIDREALRYCRFLPQPDGEHAAACSVPSVAGRPALVTGAGGYIGSALAMALAAAGARPLVLLDSSENNLFGIERRLDAAYGKVPREAVLASVTDAGLLERLFRRLRPSVIYHAAALKHVALLEHNPLAAVRNNALGTYTLAQAALDCGVPALVLVSTDKAVNPRSIMGASKRLAELAVAALSGPQCRMNAVRLGNVIGSTGSVIPIFREQIAKRGPVTVTHPEARRYFLSLAQTIAAILAAGAAECGGRILLPPMGEPERIADVARYLIAAGGSGGAIPIQFIGLRPGEKIEEDLVYAAETREGSAGPLEVLRTPFPPAAELEERMDLLAGCVAAGDLPAAIGCVSAMVPEYEPSSVVLAAAGAGSVAK